MAPRKAVIVGSLMLLGFGAVTIALFGSMLFHWYGTDELWVVSRLQGGRYITHDSSPSALSYYLGIYCVGVVFGGVCILAAVNGAFLQARRARRNHQPTE
jgi:hypothetical protein